jgi:hypothetical protein
MAKRAQGLQVARPVVRPVLVAVVHLQSHRRAAALARFGPVLPRLRVIRLARQATLRSRVGAGKRAELPAEKRRPVFQSTAGEALALKARATRPAALLGRRLDVGSTKHSCPFRPPRCRRRAIVPGSRQSHQPPRVGRVQLAGLCRLCRGASRRRTRSDEVCLPRKLIEAIPARVRARPDVRPRILPVARRRRHPGRLQRQVLAVAVPLPRVALLRMASATKNSRARMCGAPTPAAGRSAAAMA